MSARRPAAILATAIAVLLVGTSAAATAPHRPATASAPVAAQSRGPGPDLAPITRWGWVTVRDGGPSLDPTPAAKDQGNSLSSANTVSRSSAGQYTVTMGGIGDQGGMVHVSSLGSNRICNVLSWGPTPSDLTISVGCTNTAGQFRDSAFTATFLATNTSGRIAYLWANEPGTTDYTPEAFYNYNPNGANVIHRFGTGDYLVTLPGQATSRGHIQVSAFVSSGASGSAVPSGFAQVPTCRVFEWYPDFGNLNVRVFCSDANGGGPLDAFFDLTFVKGMGLKATGGSNVGYVLADRPNTASYTPDSHFSFVDPSGGITVTRQGAGAYTVRFASMPKGGTAIVTAYGAPERRCSITSIRKNGTPQKVGVQCYLMDGTAANAKFTLAFER